MTKDFRASQIQTSQIIPSGSSGTNANIIVYPASKQSTSNPNQGIIDPEKFGTGSIGNDIFFYVSGGIGERGDATNTISVFGGDLHVSGTITSDSPIGNVSASLATYGVVDYASTTNTSSLPETVGQVRFDSSKFGSDVFLGAILTAASASVTASIKLLNLDDQEFVEIGGSGIDTLSSVGTDSTFVTSVDLTTALNFNNLSSSNYELQLYSSNIAIPVIVGGAELRTTGAFTANTINTTTFVSGNTAFRMSLVDFVSTEQTASNPKVAGQIVFPADEFSGSLTLRALLSNTEVGGIAAIKLYNLDSTSFVEIAGPSQTELSVTGTTPTVVESIDLYNATNFNTSSATGYELQIFSSTGSNTAQIGGGEFRPSGSFTGVTIENLITEFVSGTTGFRIGIADYTSTTATSSNPTVAGQGIFPANEFSGSLTFRAVLSTIASATTASVRLFNATSGAYVELQSGQDALTTVSTNPTVVTSQDLFSAVNFDTTSQAVYEVHAHTSDASSQIIVGGAEFRPSGTFTANTVNTTIFTSGSWVDETGKLRTTASVSISSENEFAESLGEDVYFYVSGTFGSGSSGDKIALFGGDVKVSGTLSVGSGSAFIQDDRITFTSASIRNVGGALTFIDDENLEGQSLSSLVGGGGGFFYSNTDEVIGTSGSVEVSASMKVSGGLTVGSLTPTTTQGGILLLKQFIGGVYGTQSFYVGPGILEGFAVNTTIFNIGGESVRNIIKDPLGVELGYSFGINATGSADRTARIGLFKDSIRAGGFAGTDTTSNGYLPGLNIELPSATSSNNNLGFRFGSSNIARMTANEFQMTGAIRATENIESAGSVIAEGGMIVTSALDVGDNSGNPKFHVSTVSERGFASNTLDYSGGGNVIRNIVHDPNTTGFGWSFGINNTGTSNGFARFGLFQNRVHCGGLIGSDVTAFGLLPGLNFDMPTTTNNNVGFRFGSTNVARITSNEFQMTGTVRATENIESDETIIANAGFSGSLTTLADGSPYLLAGPNVTLTTESNGAVTISSAASGSGGSGDSFFYSNIADVIETSGSVEITGSLIVSGSITSSGAMIPEGGILIPVTGSTGQLPDATTHPGNFYIRDAGNDYRIMYRDGSNWREVTFPVNNTGRLIGKIHPQDNEGRIVLPNFSSPPSTGLDDGDIVYNTTRDIVQVRDHGNDEWFELQKARFHLRASATATYDNTTHYGQPSAQGPNATTWNGPYGADMSAVPRSTNAWIMPVSASLKRAFIKYQTSATEATNQAIIKILRVITVQGTTSTLSTVTMVSESLSHADSGRPYWQDLTVIAGSGSVDPGDQVLVVFTGTAASSETLAFNMELMLEETPEVY